MSRRLRPRKLRGAIDYVAACETAPRTTAHALMPGSDRFLKAARRLRRSTLHIRRSARSRRKSWRFCVWLLTARPDGCWSTLDDCDHRESTAKKLGFTHSAAISDFC